MAQHSTRYLLIGDGPATKAAAANIRKSDPDGSILSAGSYDKYDQLVAAFGDPQGSKGGLFHGDPHSDRYDELYVDENNQIVMVISLNPPKDLYDTLEKLPRVKPPVDGLENEIRKADFDLDLLLALD